MTATEVALGCCYSFRTPSPHWDIAIAEILFQRPVFDVDRCVELQKSGMVIVDDRTFVPKTTFLFLHLLLKHSDTELYREASIFATAQHGGITLWEDFKRCLARYDALRCACSRVLGPDRPVRVVELYRMGCMNIPTYDGLFPLSATVPNAPLPRAAPAPGAPCDAYYVWHDVANQLSLHVCIQAKFASSGKSVGLDGTSLSFPLFLCDSFAHLFVSCRNSSRAREGSRLAVPGAS